MSRAGPAEEFATGIAPPEYLRRLGQAGEGPHDIALAGLMLAALDRPEKNLAPYCAHLSELGEAAKATAGFAADAETGARALGSVIAGRYGYDGERVRYDEPANADMISLIDRRRGLPVALGILYIHAARAAGMESCGLFAPGHFLLKIVVKGSEALIDAFNGGAALGGARLTVPGIAVPARSGEPGTGEEPGPLEPVSDTDVLLRLLNNVRGRAMKAREMARAAEIGARMAMIAPGRPALWLELGRLQESQGSLSAARASYENGVKASRIGDAFHNEASLALSALKRRLN
jgi:regulator of sirC expression with transglutaminase-like and TPR domain